MGPDDLLCLRNARPGKALVGRAQWKIHSPHPSRETSRLGHTPYLILHFQKIGATFHKEATQLVEEA